MIIVLVVALLSAAGAAPAQSCVHGHGCYSASNAVAFGLCVGANGQTSEQTCCDSFCRTHPGGAGCGACPPPVCPAAANYCPVTWAGGVRPACVANECIGDADLSDATGEVTDGIEGRRCRYGGQPCSTAQPCPCVCDGHPGTVCQQQPEPPPKQCDPDLQCMVPWGAERVQQACVRSTCVKAPGARRGHAFWDASHVCEHDDECPCTCEHTGDRCTRPGPPPPPPVPCTSGLVCDSDPTQSCVRRVCIHENKHRRYGHCQYNIWEQCVVDSDCGCVCASSHRPCSPPPVPCPDYRCPANDGTCERQECRIPFGLAEGACTLCGSACRTDDDCGCVCSSDRKTRCELALTTTGSAPTEQPCTGYCPATYYRDEGDLILPTNPLCTLLTPSDDVDDPGRGVRVGNKCFVYDNTGRANLLCSETYVDYDPTDNNDDDCLCSAACLCEYQSPYDVDVAFYAACKPTSTPPPPPPPCPGRCEPVVVNGVTVQPINTFCTREVLGSPDDDDDDNRDTDGYGICASRVTGEQYCAVLGPIPSFQNFQCSPTCQSVNPANPAGFLDECLCDAACVCRYSAFDKLFYSSCFHEPPGTCASAVCSQDKNQPCRTEGVCKQSKNPNEGLVCVQLPYINANQASSCNSATACTAVDQSCTCNDCYCYTGNAHHPCLPATTGPAPTGTPGTTDTLGTTDALVCCRIPDAMASDLFQCQSLSTTDCALLAGVQETDFGADKHCLIGCTPPVIENPCCSKYDSQGNFVSCVTATGTTCDTADGYAVDADPGLCDNQCRPITGCCEFANGDLDCVSGVPPLVCTNNDPAGSTILNYCSADKCEPLMVCCAFDDGSISNAKLFDCVRDGGGTPTDPSACQVCGDQCPPAQPGVTLTTAKCSSQPLTGTCFDASDCMYTSYETGLPVLCSANTACISGVCTCDSTCGCHYTTGGVQKFLPCSDLPVTTGPATTPLPTTGHTTGAPPTTGGPTCTDGPRRCGVRPGCVGGTHDGRQCHSLNDCPGATACVPMSRACLDTEPCLDCPPTSPADAVRSCRKCIYCTADELSAGTALGFRCCPAFVGDAPAIPQQPAERCQPSSTGPSDCARKYDCECRAEPCADRYDLPEFAVLCEPTESEACAAHALAPDTPLDAVVACASSCTGSGSVDFYRVDATTHRVLRVLITGATGVVVSVSTEPLACPGTDPTVAYTQLPLIAVGEWSTLLPVNGVYSLRVQIVCVPSTYTCTPYRLRYRIETQPCPDAVCGGTPCISSRDCDVESTSCWACDRQYGRCLERRNCTTELCLSLGEPEDTCADADDGVPCRRCRGVDCQLGQCSAGVCVIADSEPTFACDCVCPRQCHTVLDCPAFNPNCLGCTRHCDAQTGVCVYRATTGTSGTRALAVGSGAECVQPALDASERAYAAHALDRFGGFVGGEQRAALCAAGVAERRFTIDPTHGALQAPCCAAVDDWQAGCFGADADSGRAWADRAWLATHHAHVHAQEGRLDEAAREACCAALLWAALGAECGRRDDAWALADTDVVRLANGPTLQAWEDGFADGDTNDFVLYVRTVELRRGSRAVATNVHTYPLARGGGFLAAYGLAFGAEDEGAVNTTGADPCPDRARRLASLDQTATRAELAAIAAAPVGTLVGVMRFGVRHGAAPPPASCKTLANSGPGDCPPGTHAVLYADTADTLPLEAPTAAELLAPPQPYRERTANTQSGTRYWPPRYGASATVAFAPGAGSTAAPRFVLRNLDCGVVVLLGDRSTVGAPLAVEVPADGALHWHWPAEGVRLLADGESRARTCHGGPRSGSAQCTSDPVCDGGYCAAPAARTGVPYPHAVLHYECAARGVDCTRPDADAACCTDEVQRWYLYMTKSAALVYAPLSD